MSTYNPSIPVISASPPLTPSLSMSLFTLSSSHFSLPSPVSLCFEYVIPSSPPPSPSDYDMFVSIHPSLWGESHFSASLHSLQFTLSISRHPIPLERQMSIDRQGECCPVKAFFSQCLILSFPNALSHMSHYKITFSPLLSLSNIPYFTSHSDNFCISISLII